MYEKSVQQTDDWGGDVTWLWRHLKSTAGTESQRTNKDGSGIKWVSVSLSGKPTKRIRDYHFISL
jgi:hypothetical protein